FSLPGTSAGDYLLSITRNGFLGAGGTNTPPSIVNLSAPPVPANVAAALSVKIADPDAGPGFTVTIAWGDGTPNTVLTIEDCPYIFDVAHQYAGQGSYPINVTVRDIYGAMVSAATTIQVTQPTAAPANIKSITYQPNGSVRLDAEGSPGIAYRIEVSNDLRTWGTLTSRTADNTGKFQLIDGPPLIQRRFYRAVWP